MGGVEWSGPLLHSSPGDSRLTQIFWAAAGVIGVGSGPGDFLKLALKGLLACFNRGGAEGSAFICLLLGRERGDNTALVLGGIEGALGSLLR